LPNPEIKSFSRLSGDFSMFFQSRHDAELGATGGKRIGVRAPAASAENQFDKGSNWMPRASSSVQTSEGGKVKKRVENTKPPMS
jgi:hypothetical protein